MRSPLRYGSAVLVGLLVLVLLFGSTLLELAVDWLWYGELGQRAVFAGILQTRLLLGLGFGAALAGLLYGNVVLARRSAPRLLPPREAREWQVAAQQLAREGSGVLLLAGSLGLGLLGGFIAAARWDEWLRFRNAQPFGQADPVFQTDIGFYVFQLPFLQFISGWLFSVLLLTAVATAAVYYLDGALAFMQERVRVTGPVHTHVSILLGLAMLARAGGYWLDRYGLLLYPGGLVYGAGYTDVHARLPALNILMVVAVAAALGFFLNARVRALWLPGAALALMVVAGLTVGAVYPSMVQRFLVAPNELSRERPYIEHHLQATRRAYGLDAIQASAYNPSRPLQAAELETERGTLDNIRLWDYRLLSQTFQRLQGLRNYYQVSDVDIDRYVVDGRYRQVMLAARELVTERLDARERRWVNERLQYTHGYGVVMSAVNEADPSGRPVWLVSDLPLKSAPGLEITRPQVYYGMAPTPPVIAPSNSAELDYPGPADNVTTAYDGSGGLPLGSSGLRTLFSLFLRDWNILISDQVKPESKLLLRRNVQERVARLAPFLRYDHDPYIVISEGRLVWIQDCYTYTDSYPYSEPTAYRTTRLLASGFGGMRETEFGRFNYLRNSVKAVVDAYTGAVTFYAMDETEPVLACYRRAFPTLFRPLADMPEGLRAHLRYPEGQFGVQSQKLLRFHVTNPDVFFQQTDVWEVPMERLREGAGRENAAMEPYYVVMRLPNGTGEQFALILPFRTRAGTTMAAWLSGGCDGPEYGKLRLYRFPTTSQVDSPEQVDQAMLADRRVSTETTLLGQVGTEVLYGNLLVLPVGKSILYVKPMFLEARQQGGRGGIPQLKNVILAEKRGRDLKIAMQPTLADALAELVGGPAPAAPEAAPGAPRPAVPAPRPAPPVGGTAELARQAQEAFEAAERAQRAGNWAEYGRQIERVREILGRLSQQAGGPR